MFMLFFTVIMLIFKLCGSHMHLHKSSSQFTCNSCFSQKPYPVRAENPYLNKQQIHTNFWKNGINWGWKLLISYAKNP